jgi:hypothetical protein
VIGAKNGGPSPFFLSKALKKIGKSQEFFFIAWQPLYFSHANSSFTISAKDLVVLPFAAIKERGRRRIYCFLKA